jgi:hypothetical protein
VGRPASEAIASASLATWRAKEENASASLADQRATEGTAKVSESNGFLGRAA